MMEASSLEVEGWRDSERGWESEKGCESKR
jgi:hypothetical protein